VHTGTLVGQLQLNLIHIGKVLATLVPYSVLGNGNSGNHQDETQLGSLLVFI
jgi:hypothetical protein